MDIKPLPSYLEMRMKVDALRAAGRLYEAEFLNAKIILMTQGGTCPDEDYEMEESEDD